MTHMGKGRAVLRDTQTSELVRIFRVRDPGDFRMLWEISGNLGDTGAVLFVLYVCPGARLLLCLFRHRSVLSRSFANRQCCFCGNLV